MGRGRGGGGEGRGHAGSAYAQYVNFHVSTDVLGHLEMFDVPIGTVRGIPLQSNTESSHITVYLTEVLWGRGLCGHEGGAGGGVTHLLEEEPTAGHHRAYMHSLFSGVVVHSSAVAGDCSPPSYRADTAKQYSANPSASCSVYEVLVPFTDIVLRSDCLFTNRLGSHLLSQLYCI